ncbi:transcriptional regulator [Agrobacterium vitis]|nr:transcriptional regulator [Agrobacterium vitis]
MTDPVALQFDELSGVLAGPDWRVTMPRREAQIFAVLLASKGRSVTADFIAEAVYDLESEPEDAVSIIQSHICKLRSKLRPVGLSIKSARFQGYSLDLRAQNVTSVAIGPLPMQDDVSRKSISLSIADNIVVFELVALGRRYSCGPQLVAAAIIKAVIANKLVDAVFDGDAPQNFNVVHTYGGGRDVDMGPRQQAVLNWLANQPVGPISVSAKTIGDHIGTHKAGVWKALQSLCRRGYVRQLTKGSAGRAASVYELVRAAP